MGTLTEVEVGRWRTIVEVKCKRDFRKFRSG